jgi:hypothetical protein
MSRLAIFAVSVVATFAVAIYAGWGSYRSSPEGLLLYTPIGPCPTMQHSFSFVYVTCLLIASAIAALVAVITFMASFVQRFVAGKPKLRSISKLCVVAVALFLGGSFLSAIFEARLPLQVKPGCQRNAP